MKNVKVVTGFFSVKAAKIEQARLIKLAKKVGAKIINIVKEDACKVYRSSGWLRSKIEKFGRPELGQVVLVVYYLDAVETSNYIVKVKQQSVKKCASIIGAAKSIINNKIAAISEAASKCKAIVTKLSSINNGHIIKADSIFSSYRFPVFYKVAA